MARTSAAFAALLAGILFIGLPAAAGGSWMYTVEDSYEAGEEVTAVGYVGATASDEVLTARMDLNPAATEESQPVWLEIGSVTMSSTGLGGYLGTRLSLTFDLPADLPDGTYVVVVNDAEGSFFGDLIGASVNVGITSPEPRWLEWPLDEPLISLLSDETVISGPGFAVPVGELRSGAYPPGAESFMLHPERLPEIATEPARPAGGWVGKSFTEVRERSPAPLAPSALPDPPVQGQTSNEVSWSLVALMGLVFCGLLLMWQWRNPPRTSGVARKHDVAPVPERETVG